MSISDNKIERDKSHIEMSAMVINFNDLLSLACLYGVNKLEFYKLSNDISEIYIRNLLDMGVFLDKYEPGGELGSSSADVLKPTMTFSYDDFSEKALR